MNKKVRNYWYTVTGILIVSLLSMAYSHYFTTLPQKYTVGTIERIWFPSKGGPVATYNYEINSQKYQRNSQINSSMKSIAIKGAKFVVSFPIEYPEKGQLLFDQKLSDSTIAPVDGWDEIPNERNPLQHYSLQSQ